MPELVGADTALGGRGRRTGLARTPRGEFAAGGWPISWATPRWSGPPRRWRPANG